MVASTGVPQVRAIAFYLPQFHPIPENDAWWGKGFTEWTNVTKARPNFRGHYQPHVPGDLGFYDLRAAETRIAQARLAREAGIHGFCFYYYWFAGKRLLFRPLEEMLVSGEPDFPFCICWANEDWTRAWDGKSSEVLIGQEHSEADSRAFIRGLYPFFRDRRYIRVKGRPLLLIYRIDIIPDLRATVDLWRRECAEAGIPDPYLVAVQSFGIGDPTPYGFDAAVEFPPHGTDLERHCNERYQEKLLNPSFTGHIVDMRRVIEVARRRVLPSYRLFRGVMPAWDNTARRQDTALIFVESSPERYEAWLSSMVAQTRERLVGDERLVFINAWNEWAEGCHLEPDQRYGHAFLDATRRALCGETARETLPEGADGQGARATPGHDGHRHPVHFPLRDGEGDAERAARDLHGDDGEAHSAEQRVTVKETGETPTVTEAAEGGGASGPGRWLFRRLPFAHHAKVELAHRAFRHLPWLVRHTGAYQRWREAQEAAIAAQQAAALLAEIEGAVIAEQEAAAVVVPPVLTATPEAAKAIVFPQCASPVVSIIVPVYGEADYTLHCLSAICATPSRASYEVIVVDDCSPDHTPELLALVTGIRLVRNETNLGFLRSCNRAAREARGDYLVLLNNDTEVLSGWLDALVKTFKSRPKAGLVGAKLLYPDRRLQESGGVIFSDGSGLNYGRDDDANRPEYNFVREVDYCAGACIMVPRRLFEQLGGFDERFVPAYYEDTDLAFAVRQAGYHVLIQPASQVIHFEGVTSGTDTSTGVKAYQLVNQEKFLAKWQDVLAGHLTRADDVWLARERGVEKRALIVDVTTPMPDKDSGSIDTMQYLRMLQALGYKVVFCPHDMLMAGRYTQALQQMGVECLYRPYVPSLEAHLEAVSGYYDLVMLERVHHAAEHLGVVRRLCPRAKVIFNTVDLHYIREERQAKVEESELLAEQARRTKALEYALMRDSDGTIVISATEREIVAQEAPEVRVAAIPYIREVVGSPLSFGERRDLVFVGGFLFPPNVDAVRYFISGIWPHVRTALPDARFLVVGSNVPDEILELAQEPGVDVLGYVEHLSPILIRCRLSVAPLRYGGGIKGKVGTSLSHGLPCVATPVAAEGMGLVDRVSAMIATDADTFAEAVIAAYRDEALWSTLSKAGLDLMREEYSFERGLERLRQLIEDCAG